MSAPDISREACERLARDLRRIRNLSYSEAMDAADLADTTILALRAALDAAERRASRIEAAWQEDGGRYWEARYRDEAALNENLAALNTKIMAERDAADATGYARGVRDAAAHVDSEVSALSAWALLNAYLAEKEPDYYREQQARYERAINMRDAILALLNKETPDAR